MKGRLMWGGALWLLRPVYVVIELAVAAATTGDYQLAHDTVSDLGTSGCSPAFCSPLHALMNATFIASGLLLAVGALLLAARLGLAVTAMLVVAGLSSVATGLYPVDQDTTLHAIAAGPLFLFQPLALLLLGRRFWRTHRVGAAALLATGAVTAAAALGFVMGAPGVGVLERLALWPVIFVLAALSLKFLQLRPPSRSWQSRTP